MAISTSSSTSTVRAGACATSLGILEPALEDGRAVLRTEEYGRSTTIVARGHPPVWTSAEAIGDRRAGPDLPWGGGRPPVLASTVGWVARVSWTGWPESGRRARV